MTGKVKILKKARTRLGSKPVSWWARRPTVELDPRDVWWANTPVRRDAVEYYKRHPNGQFERDHDGDPCVVQAKDGTLEGRNGKHRAIAAIETRRKLHVRIHTE